MGVSWTLDEQGVTLPVRRTLANGDLLRIEEVTPGGLLVRRALDADARAGMQVVCCKLPA
jgi:hypothetical protein